MAVLVVYASVYCATRGVAERIAARVSERGLTVACRPIEQAPPIANYDAVIVGSAIHNRAWLPEAAQFMAAHQHELAVRPVWLFSVGMPDAVGRPLRRMARREGPRVVAPFMATVRPRDTRLFSGMVKKQYFPLPSRLVLRLMGGRYGDFRDWPLIDAWAGRIANDLVKINRSSGSHGPGSRRRRAQLRARHNSGSAGRRATRSAAAGK